MWGGREPTKDFSGASNILWTNGQNDPWSAGGILSDISPDMKVLLLAGAAHHEDLRLPSVDDRPSVIDARKYEMSIISQWLRDWANGYSSVIY